MCECSPCWSPDNILVRFSFPVHISQVSFSLHYIAEFPFFYILCLYCLLLICSSIDELLGCFHVLAIKHLFGTLLLILLYRYPEVELLHHTVILFLISWGAAILFSNGCAILHFFPTVHRSPSNFSTFLSSLVVFYCFDRSYLNGCKMFVSISFISTLIFMIFLLMLTLDFVCSSSLVASGVTLGGLFEIFLVFCGKIILLLTSLVELHLLVRIGFRLSCFHCH